MVQKIGLSAYFSSRNAIDASIQVMNLNGMNIYRLPFNNPWQGGPHPFRYEYIDDFLSKCSHDLIIEPWHFWPIGSSADNAYRSHQDEVKAKLGEMLGRSNIGNNPRVWIELAAEYQANDLYTLMQDLADYVRNMGYNNKLVCNIWNQSWQKLDDPYFYQGYHFYWDYWSVNGAINTKLQPALDKGIKIMITEGGAHTQERSNFTRALVAEETEFLQWCWNHGCGKTIWMYEDLYNWQTYLDLGLQLPTGGPPPPDCLTAQDCLTKYGNPTSGYHWECIANECLQVKDTPEPPPPEYNFTTMHALLFRNHRLLADWGFKVRNRFIGAKIHEILHPLI